MIVTVTPNTAIDRVLFMQNFSWNHTTRAQQALWAPGGKGTDATWILGEMGMPAVALGIAAGAAGKRLQEMIERQGAKVDFVWAGGETRTTYVLIDTATGNQASITEAGLEIGPEHVAQLDAKLEAWLPQAKVLVLGGAIPPSMPNDWYTPWIRRAKGMKLPVLLDASGKTLATNAPAGPTMIKPNQDELADLTGMPVSTRAEVLAAARVPLQWGIELVVATLGPEGMVAVTADRAWYLPPIPVQAVNCAGAGDATLASMAVAYAEGWPLEDGLRLGCAASTAVVITPGTAECHLADIERFAQQVVVQEL